MISTLYVSRSGLGIAETAIQNISSNVANADTDGYIKRSVNLSEKDIRESSGTNQGVSVESIERQTDSYMYYNLVDETSTQSYINEVSSILENAETIFDETDESGFTIDLDNFFQALESFRTDPNDELAENEVITQGTIIVEDIQTIYENLEDLKTQTKSELNKNIDTVNNILNQISDINEELSMTDSSTINDLLDKRENLEMELASYVDVDVSENNGVYELSIAGKAAISFNTNVHELSLNEDYTNQNNVYSNSFSGDYTLTLDNGASITLTGVTSTTDIVNAINGNSSFSQYVQASVDGNGYLSVSPSSVAMINGEGTNAKFSLEILDNNATPSSVISRNENLSKDAADNYSIVISQKEITLDDGKIKAQVENLDTSSSKNYITQYQNMLDNFVAQLVDLTGSYVLQSDGTYVSGNDDTEVYSGTGSVVSLNIFSGSDVNSFSFNENSVQSLSQEKLNYLSTLQWEDDIDFDGTGNNNSSFMDYYQEILTTVSSDKENIDYKKETQDSVVTTLTATYDAITGVDTDEEMINLIEFQAAYEANAKMITAIDEMLQTILNM